MKIDSNIAIDDVHEFGKIVEKNISKLLCVKYKIIIANIIYWIPIGFAGAAIYKFYKKVPIGTFNSIDYALIAIGIWALYAYVIDVWQKKEINKNSVSETGNTLGEQSVVISEENLFVTSKNSEFTYDWCAIQNIKETKNGIYLFLDRAKAIIIPNRDLAEGQANELIYLVRQYAKL